jgi:tetratricopeptide (TPR) repeat protein
MKKFGIKILVLFLLVSSYVFSADVNTLMQKGNEYYRSNQFQLAIDEYNKLVSEGYEGASLYYNLGNAHYRLGKVGYAILFYEKALKFSPNDEDIKHNLALAKLNLTDKVDSLPPFFIFTIWEGLLSSFSITGWTILAYIFFILLLIAVVIYFFARSSTQQRISFFSGVGFLVLLSLSIILLAVKMNKEFKIKDGIIVEPAVTAKYSPDTSAKDGFIIHEGLKVRLEDRLDNWVKIRLDDGKVGWILENSVGEI